MNPYINLLDRLAKAEPEICIGCGDEEYRLGDYMFWVDPPDVFTASHVNHLSSFIKDVPALAWLRDACETVIGAKGWDYSVEYGFWCGGDNQQFCVTIEPKSRRNILTENTDKTLALLTALVEAVESETNNG